MTAEERRIEEIARWFEGCGRKLLLKELDDGWEAIYALDLPGVGTFPPAAFSKTRLQAAENAVAQYRADPNLSGDDSRPDTALATRRRRVARGVASDHSARLSRMASAPAGSR
jgi:hypothetical protein